VVYATKLWTRVRLRKDSELLTLYDHS
jgi:hypothetical protein